MKRFIALYLTPASVLKGWMEVDAETRKAAEAKMGAEWDAWTQKHGSRIIETAATGGTKRVTPSGIEDAANDVMMYSIVEAEDKDAAAAMFEGHPHLQIPEATIEVMNVTPMAELG
jgi:hypothetical protein